jgi:hypothetical protein
MRRKNSLSGDNLQKAAFGLVGDFLRHFQASQHARLGALS